MGTAEGSSGGSPTGGPSSGDVSLNPDRVNQIADRVGRQATRITDIGLPDETVPGGGFGGSGAGQELANVYQSAHGHSVAQNTTVEGMLTDYEVGLRGAVQDQLESDELNAVALNRIGAIDPGRSEA